MNKKPPFHERKKKIFGRGGLLLKQRGVAGLHGDHPGGGGGDPLTKEGNDR